LFNLEHQRTAGILMSRGVLFEKKAQKIGRVWALIATHPSGQQEDVIGFHTEEEAKRWRKSNGYRAWLRTRGYLVKPDNEEGQ
jgi:hypothetical protein